MIVKGENEKVKPASISKLFSIYYANTFIKPDHIIHTRQETYNLIKPNSSVSNLKPGDYYAKNIYHALLASSGNDAMYALADSLGGELDSELQDVKERVDYFTNRLNNFLQEENLTDTYIYDVTGFTEKIIQL